MIDIVIAGHSDLPGIDALYREAGYGAPIGADDTLIVARTGTLVVGAVRLCAEEGVTVLRGMHVKRSFQRQGIGARLLEACLPHLDAGPAYCIPYTHLVSFYAGAGFELLAGSDLPPFLAQRLAGYQVQGQPVLAMHRAAAR
jgi:predicted N-acetyltransferase YhbS